MMNIVRGYKNLLLKFFYSQKKFLYDSSYCEKNKKSV